MREETIEQTEKVPQGQENKMGTMPVPKLLITMSLPLMVSMFVQALYNVVDSVFVARWNENAFTGLTLAFPLQQIMIAVSTGLGVGMNALLSKSLGEKNIEKANAAAKNGLFMGLISGVVFTIVGILFSRSVIAAQISDPEIIGFGADYLSICMIIGYGVFGGILFERLLQSTGRTLLSMMAQLLGAVTNLILDPIMIFGYFGFPEMGVKGAALATVIGQIVGAIFALFLNLHYNKELTLSFRGFRPNGAIIKTILKVGIPSILMQAVSCVTVFVIDKILVVYETAAVTVYGIYFKIQSFIFFPIFGMTNGLIPIVAYNYGARKKKRIMQAVRWGIGTGLVLAAVGFYLLHFRAEALLWFFSPSARVRELAIPALGIISFLFFFASYGVVSGSVFQALGNGVYSLILTLVRQIVFLIPLVYLIGKFYGIDAIWWAFPLAECVSVVVATLFLFRIYRKKIRDL
jgi:putative MATE family efflux protein